MNLRWMVIGLGVLVAGLVAFGVRVFDDDRSSARGEQPSTVTVEEPIVLHEVRFEVTGVRKARKLFEAEQPTRFDEARQTSGVFVAVDLALRNVGDERASASVHGSSLVGGNGQTYPLDSLSRGTYYDLQPDLAESARLVFELTPTAAPGSVLNLADCPLNDVGEPADCTDARVELGLR